MSASASCLASLLSRLFLLTELKLPGREAFLGITLDLDLGLDSDSETLQISHGSK